MKHLIYGLFVILIFSCYKDDNKYITGCGNKTGQEENDWLVELQKSCRDDDICKLSIARAIYNNETVYFTSVSGELCDPAYFNVVLRDCNGDTVKVYNWDTYQFFEEEVEDIETIFTCP